MLPLSGTVLRPQYGSVITLAAAPTALPLLQANRLAFLGRVLNTARWLDFFLQVRMPAMQPRGLKRLSIYVGAGADATLMPDGDSIDNLVKIGEVGVEGAAGWSSLISVARTLNILPPVVDFYAKNDAGVLLPNTPQQYQAIVLPAANIWE